MVISAMKREQLIPSIVPKTPPFELQDGKKNARTNKAKSGPRIEPLIAIEAWSTVPSRPTRKDNPIESIP